MKKTLLLASAAVLFAGTAQAAGLEMGIEGYASVYGVYADQDNATAKLTNEFGIRKEMEIAITGEVALENGLTVGATVELQQAQSAVSEDVQESHIFVEGGFGKVIVGQEYNAAYLMQVAAPAVDAEFDGMDPTYNVVTENGTINDQSYDMSNQALTDAPLGDKISYISPIWEGLQVGASFTPDTGTVNSQGTISQETQEAYAVAARYATELAGADVTIGAGYNQTDVASDTNSYDQWNVGVTAEIDAWTVGAAYYDAEQTTKAQEEQVIAVGVNYETGPFNYGASYLNKEVGATDELDRYMVGVNYTYGPGMTLNGSVGYHSYDHATKTSENDATVVAVGTVINF